MNESSNNNNNEDIEEPDPLVFMCYDPTRPVDTKGFSFTEKNLGSGTFGSVISVNMNGRSVAVKQMRHENNSSLSWSCLREFVNVSELQEHPNIIQVYGSNFFTSPNLIVMEKADTDLAHVMGHLSWPSVFEKNILKYMQQLLMGVDFMHKHNIWHLDLKPTNLLIFKGDDGRMSELKITDFGLSLSNPPRNTSDWLDIVTLPYRPPELLMKRILRKWNPEPSFEFFPYGPQLDSFSCGVIYMLMLQNTTRQNAVFAKKKLDVLMTQDIEEHLKPKELQDPKKFVSERDVEKFKKLKTYLDFWNPHTEHEHILEVFKLLDIENTNTSMDWSTLEFQTREKAYLRMHHGTQLRPRRGYNLRFSECLTPPLASGTVTLINKSHKKEVEKLISKYKRNTPQYEEKLNLINAAYASDLKENREQWVKLYDTNTKNINPDKVRRFLDDLIGEPLTDESWELLSSLLCCDPRRRILPGDALKLNIFADLQNSVLEMRQTGVLKMFVSPPGMKGGKLTKSNIDLSDWQFTVNWLRSISLYATGKEPILFSALTHLRCFLSRVRMDWTKQKRRDFYIYYGAVCLELTSLYMTTDSVDYHILGALVGLEEDKFRHSVREMFYVLGGKLIVTTPWTILQEYINRPDIFNKVKKQHTYQHVLLFIESSPLFEVLTDTEMAKLTLYVCEGIDLNDTAYATSQENKEEGDVLDMEELKQVLLEYAERHYEKDPENFMVLSSITWKDLFEENK